MSNFFILSLSAAPTPSIRVAVQRKTDDQDTRTYKSPGVSDSFVSMFTTLFNFFILPFSFVFFLFIYFVLIESYALNAGEAVYMRVGTEPDGAGGTITIAPSITYTSNIGTNTV